MALFSDEQPAAGNATAAQFPPGQVAHVDHGNGTYSEVQFENLTDFDDPSADLVIPESVQERNDTIDGGNGPVSIVAGSITSRTDIRSKNQDVTLTAASGGIDVGGTGIAIDGGSGNIDISAPGDVNLTGATLKSGTRAITVSSNDALVIDDTTIDATGGQGEIDMAGRTVSAKNSQITSKNREIQISATRNGGGEFVAQNADITVLEGNGGIHLESNGTMNLNDAGLAVNSGGPEVALGSGSPTLFADGTVINDGSGMLYYSPGSAAVDPDRSDIVENN